MAGRGVETSTPAFITLLFGRNVMSHCLKVLAGLVVLFVGVGSARANVNWDTGQPVTHQFCPTGGYFSGTGTFSVPPGSTVTKVTFEATNRDTGVMFTNPCYFDTTTGTWSGQSPTLVAGRWAVQVVVEYKLNGQTFDDTSLTDFRNLN